MEQDTPARPGAIAQTVERRLEVDKLNDSKEPQPAAHPGPGSYGRTNRSHLRAFNP